MQITLKLTVVLAVAALAACEPSELRPIPVGGGDIAPGAPAQPARPPAQPLAPPAQPMLQDPEENLEDESIDVKADSLEEAETACGRTATSLSDSQTIVTCLGCVKRTTTTNKYTCTLRIETRSL